jgi:hypothetical protein
MEELRYSCTILSSVLDGSECLGPRTGINAMQKSGITFSCREPNSSYPGSYWIITVSPAFLPEAAVLLNHFTEKDQTRSLYYNIMSRSICWTLNFSSVPFPWTLPGLHFPSLNRKTTASLLYPNFWFMFYLFCCLKFWSMRLERKVGLREGRGVDRNGPSVLTEADF